MEVIININIFFINNTVILEIIKPTNRITRPFFKRIIFPLTSSTLHIRKKFISCFVKTSTLPLQVPRIFFWGATFGGFAKFALGLFFVTVIWDSWVIIVFWRKFIDFPLGVCGLAVFLELTIVCAENFNKLAMVGPTLALTVHLFNWGRSKWSPDGSRSNGASKLPVTMQWSSYLA
jgi:hypothetical protein